MTALQDSPELVALRARGFVTDEWDRWQQGDCGLYAAALVRAYPTLRVGTLAERVVEGCEGCNWEGCSNCTFDPILHHFAHDDAYAYDSAGKHLLPYTGVDPELGLIAELGSKAEEWGWEVPAHMALPDHLATVMADALAHAQRHGILPD